MIHNIPDYYWVEMGFILSYILRQKRYTKVLGCVAIAASTTMIIAIVSVKTDKCCRRQVEKKMNFSFKTIQSGGVYV